MYYAGESEGTDTEIRIRVPGERSADRVIDKRSINEKQTNRFKKGPFVCFYFLNFRRMSYSTLQITEKSNPNIPEILKFVNHSAESKAENPP